MENMTLAFSLLPLLSGVVGKGGYGKVLLDIRKKDKSISGLYDVKVDRHIFSILRICRRVCFEVTARGLRRAGP